MITPSKIRPCERTRRHAIGVSFSDSTMAPVKITARSVVVSAGTLVGASGAVYAVGYVIDLSFRDLLGVDRVSYLSTLGLGLNVAQMISAIATALARTVLIHPIIATLTLIAVIAATIYGVLLVVRRQPTVPQPYLYLYLTLLTIVVILKTLYFCLPFTDRGTHARPMAIISLRSWRSRAMQGDAPV